MKNRHGKFSQLIRHEFGGIPKFMPFLFLDQYKILELKNGLA